MVVGACTPSGTPGGGGACGVVVVVVVVVVVEWALASYMWWGHTQA